MEYFSKPIRIKAIKYTGLNSEEVINLISLNKGHAQVCYVDKEGRRVENGVITEFRALQIMAGPGQWILAFKDDYIVLNDEDAMYPIPGISFEQFYVKEIGEVSNGHMTFNQYIEAIQRHEPSKETLEAGPNFQIPEDASFDLVEFIKQNANVTQFSDGRTFYTINGNIFIF